SSYFQNDMNDKLNVIHRDIKSANILRSPGYIADSDPEDPEEDPTTHIAN
ncbi:kinase-like domain, phloem protein 2-like protein, partial [Tanacetum coccineum]